MPHSHSCVGCLGYVMYHTTRWESKDLMSSHYCLRDHLHATSESFLISDTNNLDDLRGSPPQTPAWFWCRIVREECLYYWAFSWQNASRWEGKRFSKRFLESCSLCWVLWLRFNSCVQKAVCLAFSFLYIMHVLDQQQSYNLCDVGPRYHSVRDKLAEIPLLLQPGMCRPSAPTILFFCSADFLVISSCPSSLCVPPSFCMDLHCIPYCFAS